MDGKFGRVTTNETQEKYDAKVEIEILIYSLMSINFILKGTEPSKFFHFN